MWKGEGSEGEAIWSNISIDLRARFEPEHPLFTARKGRGQGNRKK